MIEFTAKWKDVQRLYELEKASLGDNTSVRGSSRLTDVAVQPKPIERQKVATCLRVFCDETCSAMRAHPEMKDAEGTHRFIQKIVDIWKMLNVRTRGKDIRHRDPREKVIESQSDARLGELLEHADFFKDIGKKPGGKRLFMHFWNVQNAVDVSIFGKFGRKTS